MHILLLGATGLLGQAIERVAVRRGNRISGVARKDAEISLDVSDARGLAALVERGAYDLVVNCAAITDLAVCERDPGLAYLINARPAAILALACQRAGASFCHVSTDHYHVDGGRRAHSEEETVTLVNEYARSKYAGEGFARINPEALVLRTSIVGLRGWEAPTLAEWAISVLEQDLPATLYSDAFTSSIDTESFADAALDMIEKGARGLYNLAASDVYSKEEFVLAMAAALGCTPTRLDSSSIPTGELPRANSLGLDVSRASAILGRRLPGLPAVIDSILRQR